MEHKTLYAALNAAQRAINPVSKDKVNDFGRYRYAPAEDIMEEARAALVANGLCLFVKQLRSEPADLPYGDGSRKPGSIVEMQLVLAHTSGESQEFCMRVPAPVEKGRPADKAEAAAQTFGLGYFLRNLLLIPRSDEREREHQVDARREQDARPTGQNPGVGNKGAQPNGKLGQQPGTAGQTPASAPAGDNLAEIQDKIRAAAGSAVALAKLAGSIPKQILDQLPDEERIQIGLARIETAPDLKTLISYGNAMKGTHESIRTKLTPAFEKRMGELAK